MTTTSTLPIFSKSPSMISLQEQGYWRGRYRRECMRRSKEDTGNTRVGNPLLHGVPVIEAKLARLGTWVPLAAGRSLAQKNGVLEKLLPIFDYVAGDISPPQAPKHTTNSNKPKVPKAAAVKKIPSTRSLSFTSPYNADEQNPKHSQPIARSARIATTLVPNFMTKSPSTTPQSLLHP